MRQMEQDGEYIWLRQSVTFTVAGQTRTVEIAIPLRPGATAEDVEALLSEADAGMERLSRRLDDRVAALLNGTADVPAPQTERPAAPMPAPSAVPPAARTEPDAALERQLSAPQAERPAAPAPAPARPPARPANDAPAAASAPPTRPAPQHAPARPAAAQSAPRPAPPAAAPTPVRGRASGPIAIPPSSGPDITRQEFIAAAQELGLNVKQAMERLNVRSLEGLNLREALEALRRQAVRGDTPPSDSAPARSTPAPAPAAPRVREAAPPEPRYFDEEDDLDVTFSVDGDDELDDGFPPYADALPPGDEGPVPLDEIEELDLDDVPDFGPPPSASRSSGASGRRAAPATPARPAPAPVQEPPAAAPEADAVGVSGNRARALQLVGQMRSARGGGAPSSYQRAAYRNVVARELGEPEAAALVRGLWRTTPERLSAEQLDALISWGKQDTFSEEAALVLAELRAERERAANATAGAIGEQPPAGEAPRAAPRGRGAGTGRSAPGGR